MSSLRNAVKRKTHKERAQPTHRRKLGFLEKKKDYKLRADDYHRKEKRIKTLQQKASFRNPDEFYFKMINSQTKNGIHRIEKDLPSDDVTKLIRSQNIAYLQMNDSMESSKITKLRDSLHFIGDQSVKNTHTVFLDEDEDAADFNKAKYFETTEEFQDRSFNRPTAKQLASKNLLVKGDVSELKEALKLREKSYYELEQRIGRKEMIRNALDHMEMNKKLSSKGRRTKVKDAVKGQPAVYKWKQERKR